MGSKSGLVGRPGPVPLRGQREEFARLIARGVSNSEACRMVGVNWRTGTRWRYGRTVTSSSGAELDYQPVTTTTKPGLSARFLSEDERVVIGDRAGLGRACVPSGASWGVRRRRSAGRCTAMVMLSPGTTGRSPRTAWPWRGWLDLENDD
jgi:hypothetical protein